MFILKIQGENTQNSLILPMFIFCNLNFFILSCENKFSFFQSLCFKLSHSCSNVTVQSFSCVWLFATLSTAALHVSLSITTPGVYSNSWPLNQWCHPAISSSAIHFSSHFQSFPALGSFSICQFFSSGGQSIGVSGSASVLPMNTQDWFPSGLVGLISLQCKGLSRVFSNTTVQKHQVFSAQLPL